EDAGRLSIPFTTGILVGIGETETERAESLLAIRDLHRRYGHVQEVIVQNFRAKPGTAMRDAPEPDAEEFLAAVATARVVLGPRMSVQAPPNLSDPEQQLRLLDAGIDDWGGVSPVTPDHVNPERPWPAIEKLAETTASRGLDLRERLTIYPPYALRPDPWIAGTMRAAVLALFRAEGEALEALCRVADDLRRDAVGDDVTYVVNRNVNFTNVCYVGCRFCAFAQREVDPESYTLTLSEVADRAEEARDWGA